MSIYTYLCLSVSLSIYPSIYLSLSLSLSIFIGIDRVWSARRRFTMRRRSTRTSARGTPPAWSTWPGYAPSPMKRCGQALGRGSTRRSRVCGDTSYVCAYAHARVCACVCACTCIRTHVHICPYEPCICACVPMCVSARASVCAFGRTHPNAHTHSHVFAMTS